MPYAKEQEWKLLMSKQFRKLLKDSKHKKSLEVVDEYRTDIIESIAQYNTSTVVLNSKDPLLGPLIDFWRDYPFRGEY
jgi:hypothetical protein